MLHIFYRAFPDERMEVRPPFFSKKACLRNFIRAFHHTSDASFCMIFDGHPDDDFCRLVDPIGTIEVLPCVGNSKSLWHAITKAMCVPEDDPVYFAEDDYLHCPDALAQLLECFQDVSCDYITLYDHPVRYMNDYSLGSDWPLNENGIYISRSRHWRTVESTCMTFGTKARTLKEDISIFEQYVHRTQKPADRELFRHLQGLGSYKRDSPMRKLVGPIPSLATHCHLPWLAPLVNWEQFVDERGV